MNNIDIARKYVIMHLKRFSIMHDMKNGTDTYNTAYIEQHADQIIFELIKETYIDKTSTAQCHCMRHPEKPVVRLK